MVGKKEIDLDRYYYNHNTKDKIYSHYIDGTEIKLSDTDSKNAEKAKLACTAYSIKEVESDPSARKKPLEKRGRKPKEEKEVESKK